MKVGVVGAGISGVVTGAHLLKADIDITVFERSGQAGGIWLYDDRVSLEPTYPATNPSYGESDEKSGSEFRDPSSNAGVRHAPPGLYLAALSQHIATLTRCQQVRPCYEGLTNNVSTRLLRLKLNAWSEGTLDYVNHSVIKEYIGDTARKAGVHKKTLYDTQVEKIEKNGQNWEVTTSMLSIRGKALKVQKKMFDAVVIANGHYNACRVPNIPGLADWKTRWPGRVQHSKTYRRPSSFKGQNVLLVGAGVSSTDIARELEPEANKIYQTSRGGAWDMPATLLPSNGTRVSDIGSFETPIPVNLRSDLNPMAPIPYIVVLRDKRILTNIHRIIICTGYHISLPFLRSYHSDTTAASKASDTILVTDGTQYHNLHKDIFYIPDPTLAFVGVPYFTATFTLFEFQAIALAAVWSGKADLPSEEEMRKEYKEKLEKKGSGKGFHSLKGEEVAYASSLVEWLNRDGAKVGAELVEGHDAAWHVANADRIALFRQKGIIAAEVGS